MVLWIRCRRPRRGRTPGSVGSNVERAADGDYKVANALSSKVKDNDGDYKPVTAASSAAAQSSSAVQVLLSSLTIGG